MKIAVVSDDGSKISQHFGRALHYVVITVENGNIVAREKREKLGHAHFAKEHHGREVPAADGRGHGFDAASQSKHERMASAITDCAVLLARGMGVGAFESLRQAGIRPIVTDMIEVDEAVRAYIEGRLVDHPERLH